MWHEGEGGRGANDVGSCVMELLEKWSSTPIILSDKIKTNLSCQYTYS